MFKCAKLKKVPRLYQMAFLSFFFVILSAISIVIIFVGVRKNAWHKKMMKLDNQTLEEREKENQKDLENNKKEINY